MASSLVAVLILIKADIVGRVAYAIEKGRLRAMREALPTAQELDARFDADRVVVRTVLPAVVSISTERVLTRADFDELDPRLHRFLFPRERTRRPNATSNGAGETEDSAASPPSAPDQPRDPPTTMEGDTDGDGGSGTNGLAPGSTEEPLFRIPPVDGSGFIIDAANGYVVTNTHVVAQARSISVRLADGRQVEARVLGIDRQSDVAVLKIDADRLHEVTWGDSQAMEVGDAVFAVGNPFRLEGTVSRGIVSAKNRSNIALPDVEYEGFLQTDAVINPGNSGGPLVNMRGEVVGINTAIATGSDNYDGIGFAIPAHRAVRVVPYLTRGERVARGYLGVVMTTGPRAETVKTQTGWKGPGGVVVTEIAEGSPASRSALRVNDIIAECEGRPVRSNADVIDTVGDTAPGTKLALKIWRDGAFMTVRVEVGAQPEGFSTRGWRPQPRRE
jgi:S1-C subfamily serine protease